MLAAQSSKNGGTASWGAGLTLHIGSTTPTIGNNYQRLWLGLNEPRALEPPSRSAAAARGAAAPRLRAPAVLVAHPIAAILCAGLAAITIAHVRRHRGPSAPSRSSARDVESVSFRDFAAADDDSDDDDRRAAARFRPHPAPPPRLKTRKRLIRRTSPALTPRRRPRRVLDVPRVSRKPRGVIHRSRTVSSTPPMARPRVAPTSHRASTAHDMSAFTISAAAARVTAAPAFANKASKVRPRAPRRADATRVARRRRGRRRCRTSTAQP